MSFRVVQAGSGATRDLVICYYVGNYADDQVRRAAPAHACIINDTKTPTRRYTRIDSRGIDGILPMKQAIEWALGRCDFDAVRYVLIGGYSAGGQAVRTQVMSGAAPNAIFIADGNHCSAPPVPWQLKAMQAFCDAAASEEKVAVFSHTQIEPPTYTGTRRTLELLTGFELDESGPLEEPVETGEGNLEVWSFEGANAEAHRQQAQRVFSELLGRAVEMLDLDDSTHVEDLALVDPANEPWQDPTQPLGVRALLWTKHQQKIGVREIPPGSNSGPMIAEYFKPTTRIRNGREIPLGISRGNWCSVSACAAAKAALLPGEQWDEVVPHGYRAGVVELVRDAKENGRWFSAEELQAGEHWPELGDLAIFDRSKAGQPHTSWWRHVARVSKAPKPEGREFFTLGGNEGNEFRTTRRSLHDPKFLGVIAYPQDVAEPIRRPPAEPELACDAFYCELLLLIEQMIRFFVLDDDTDEPDFEPLT